MPPAPRRRTISNCAISFGGGGEGGGLGHREPEEALLVYTRSSRRPSWATRTNTDPRPPRAARSRRRRSCICSSTRSTRSSRDASSSSRRTSATRLILFVAGEPAEVRTSEPVAYLGQRAAGARPYRRARAQPLARGAREAQGGRAQAPRRSCCSRRGLIDATKLRAGLAEQIGRKLHHVAAMPADTAYAYYDGFDVLRGWGGDDGAPADPVPHLWNMVREYTPWEHVNAALARLGTSRLRLTRGADVGRLRLAKEEADLAELLRSRPLRPAELAKAGTAQRADRAAPDVPAARHQAGRRARGIRSPASPQQCASRRRRLRSRRAQAVARLPLRRCLRRRGRAARRLRLRPGCRPSWPSAGRRSSTAPRPSIAPTTS